MRSEPAVTLLSRSTTLPRRWGVRKQTVLYHFGSKAELFEATIDSAIGGPWSDTDRCRHGPHRLAGGRSGGPRCVPYRSAAARQIRHLAGSYEAGRRVVGPRNTGYGTNHRSRSAISVARNAPRPYAANRSQSAVGLGLLNCHGCGHRSRSATRRRHRTNSARGSSTPTGITKVSRSGASLVSQALRLDEDFARGSFNVSASVSLTSARFTVERSFVGCLGHPRG